MLVTDILIVRLLPNLVSCILISFQTFPCCHEEDVKENIVKPSREQMELATDKDCEVR
jgi:hypothetical protein